MMIALDELAKFLVRAKMQTYAGDGNELQPQRPGFKELEYVEGDLTYRDSYAGYFFASGQEIVRHKNIPIWAMAYSGGMLREYHGNKEFAKKTFIFLKKVLGKVETKKPFRGPKIFSDSGFLYKNYSQGDISDFKGTEHIFYKRKEVFRQNYIGGVIILK